MERLLNFILIQFFLYLIDHSVNLFQVVLKDNSFLQAILCHLVRLVENSELPKLVDVE